MRRLLCLILVALLIAHVPQCGGQGQSPLSSMASNFASKIKARLQGVIGKKLDELPAGPPDSAGDEDDEDGAEPSASQPDDDDDDEDADASGPAGNGMIMPRYRPGITVVMGMPPWDECKSVLESCHECTVNAFGGVQMMQIMGCLKQCYARADEEDAAGMQSAIESGGDDEPVVPARRRKRSPQMMKALVVKIDDAVADADLNDENLLKDIMQSLTEDLMAMCNADEIVDCMSDYEDEIQTGCDLPDVPYANMTMMVGGKLQRMQMMLHMKVYHMVKYAVMKRMRLVNAMPRPEPMMKDGATPAAMPMYKSGAMGGMSMMHPAYGMMGMIGAMMHKKPCGAAQQCLADAQIDLDKILNALKECGGDEDKRRVAMVCGAQMKHRMCTCQMSKPMRTMAKECMAPGMKYMLHEQCSLEREMATNRIRIINKGSMSAWPTYDQCKAHVEKKWQCTERVAGDFEGGDPMELHKCKQMCARKSMHAKGGVPMNMMDTKSQYKAVSHDQFMELMAFVNESMSQHENMTEWYMAVKEKASEIFGWPDMSKVGACMQQHHADVVDACGLPNAPEALEWQHTLRAHIAAVMHAQIAKAHGMMKFVAMRYGDKAAARHYHKDNGYHGHTGKDGMHGEYAMKKSAGSCHDEVNMCLWDKGMDYESVWKGYAQCYTEEKESEGGDMHGKYGMRVNYAACPAVLRSKCCQCYNTEAFATMVAECAPNIEHEPVDCDRAQAHSMAGDNRESMVTEKLKHFLHGALQLLQQMNSRGQSMAHKG